MIARKVIGLILFFLTLSNANAASILLRTYKSPVDKADKALLKVYLDGVKEGIVMFNVTLQAEGRQPLFCQPEKLALTVSKPRKLLCAKPKRWLIPIGFLFQLFSYMACKIRFLVTRSISNQPPRKFCEKKSSSTGPANYNRSHNL